MGMGVWRVHTARQAASTPIFDLSDACPSHIYPTLDSSQRYILATAWHHYSERHDCMQFSSLGFLLSGLVGARSLEPNQIEQNTEADGSVGLSCLSIRGGRYQSWPSGIVISALWGWIARAWK